MHGQTDIRFIEIWYIKDVRCISELSFHVVRDEFVKPEIMMRI